MNAIKLLSRNDMRMIKGGDPEHEGLETGPCSVSVTCPSGWTMECNDPREDGFCYSEGDGTIHGYINCGVGAVQIGCWMHEPY